LENPVPRIHPVRFGTFALKSAFVASFNTVISAAERSVHFKNNLSVLIPFFLHMIVYKVQKGFDR